MAITFYLQPRGPSRSTNFLTCRHQQPYRFGAAASVRRRFFPSISSAVLRSWLPQPDRSICVRIVIVGLRVARCRMHLHGNVPAVVGAIILSSSIVYTNRRIRLDHPRYSKLADVVWLFTTMRFYYFSVIAHGSSARVFFQSSFRSMKTLVVWMDTFAELWRQMLLRHVTSSFSVCWMDRQLWGASWTNGYNMLHRHSEVQSNVLLIVYLKF